MDKAKAYKTLKNAAKGITNSIHSNWLGKEVGRCAELTKLPSDFLK
jgi:hypothetical protein